MIKKRFKVEVFSHGISSEFEVELRDDQHICECYHQSNNSSYVFDDINGIRHICPRDYGIIEITPLVMEITYKEKDGI